MTLKPGTIRTRYPGGDPENGPAYPQRWNGHTWECAGHVPEWDNDAQGYTCRRCGCYIVEPTGE